MNHFLLDLQFNLRLLRKTPVFTGICFFVVIIGMTTALTMHALTYEFFNKPTEFEGGKRFVSVRLVNPNPARNNFTPFLNDYSFNYIADRVKSLDMVDSIRFRSGLFQNGEQTFPLNVATLTPNLAATTQQPILGRTFNQADLEAGGTQPIVLSEGIWRNYFNGDDNIIGKLCRFDGQNYTIIGVVPEQANYTGISDIYLALDISLASDPKQAPALPLLGRLAPGATAEQANLELNSLLQQLNHEYPDIYDPLMAEVTSFSSLLINMAPPTSGIEQSSVIIQWVTAIIFLLVAINLSSLLFVRANARMQELAVRNAVGASIWAMAKQILLEAFLICFIGMLISLLVSAIALSSLETLYEPIFASASMSRMPIELGLNGQLITVAIVLLIALWLLASGFATFRVAGKSIVTTLSDGGKSGVTNRSTARLTKSVVGVEVIICCFLLIVCGVISISVLQIYRTDIGVEASHRFSGKLELPPTSYRQIQDKLVFVDNLEQKLLEDPAIKAVTITSALPGNYGLWTPYALADRDLKNNDRHPIQMQVWVANNFFDTVEAPIIEGRAFDSRDTENSLPVIIVSDWFSRYYWPNESALGKQIQVNPPGLGFNDLTPNGEPTWLTVVGVNKHIIQSAPMQDGKYYFSIYRPLTQGMPSTFYTVLDAESQALPQPYIQHFRDIVAGIDRNVPVMEFDSLINGITQGYSGIFLLGKITFVLAMGTLFLSAVAIFGVVSRSVMSRTVEIGLRRALGSNNFQVVWIFLKQGLSFLLLGAVLGGVPAIITSNLMSLTFPEILHLIPWVTVVVMLAIGLFIFMASWLPARKAVALEPGDALRDQ